VTTRYVAVVGPGDDATDEQREAAREVGRLLAERGAIVLTGGRNGVMAAAAAGASGAGGIAVGILPGSSRADGDPAHAVLLATGLGELRNGPLVRCADAVIAIGGSWGTLSEVALAMRTDTPLVTVGHWQVPDARAGAATPVDAVAAVLSSP
jgi:uncharacterized protein (TIGR00725 family)